MALTLRQVEDEKRYRYAERLGILCGDGQPTPQQEAMARREADSWERARMLARMLLGSDRLTRGFRSVQTSYEGKASAKCLTF